MSYHMFCCVPIIWCRMVVCLRVTLLVLFRTLLLMCVCVKIVFISVSYLSFLSITFLCFMSIKMVNKRCHRLLVSLQFCLELLQPLPPCSCIRETLSAFLSPDIFPGVLKSPFHLSCGICLLGNADIISS